MAKKHAATAPRKRSRPRIGVNSSPRGLLPTPPEVKKLLARELKGHPVSDRERQRLTDCWNMEYYFGDEEILYRHTRKGVEVLAVGSKEIRDFMDQLPLDEHGAVVLGHPGRWGEIDR